jgi:hypothetical protein
MSRTNQNRKKRNAETRRRLRGCTPLSQRSRLARAFARMAETMLDKFTVMLAISTTATPIASEIILNGSGSLVQMGERPMLVTNHHVYEAFRARRKENPHVKFLMTGEHGSRLLDISPSECVGESEDVDLAVLSLPPKYVLEKGKLFWIAEHWPPKRPSEGMLAVLVGFPGEGRRVEPDGTLGVSPLVAVMRVVSVSSRHFIIADEDQDAHVYVPPGQKWLKNFGGVSGSAVHAVQLQGDEIGNTWLCGFVKEEGPGHTLLVAHADHIRADGSIP